MSKPRTITLIGAGLVGSLLAIFLARRGYRVEVFERLVDIRKESVTAGRSINLALANRGINALAKVGLMSEVDKLLIPMRGRALHDDQSEVEFQPYGQKPEEVIYSVSRAGLVSLLRDHAEATGTVTFHFSHALESIDFGAKSCRFTDLRSSTEVIHEYDILLGSDGAGSTVRRAMQVQMDSNFSAELLDHSYKELTIEPDSDGGWRIDKNALHIWPRGGFMLIALANLDGSFTVTLFLPNEGEVSFESLSDEAAVEAFFTEYFPDLKALIPTAAKQFFANPTGVLGTVRCEQWQLGDAMILGDASHAIVPFHGQGMNAGFEDCAELARCLEQTQDDWEQAMPLFVEARRGNANAIADMALDNYIEMRNSVRDPKFHLKKQIAFRLENLLPNYFIPRYSMVMFHLLPYQTAQSRGVIQAEILDRLIESATTIAEVDWDYATELVTGELSPLSELD